MLKVGIIGYNNGNGHPYSYSAIFNGFNKKELLKNCPYPIIQKYLIKDHRNKNHSPKAIGFIFENIICFIAFREQVKGVMRSI